jgi:hypothetical protein
MRDETALLDASILTLSFSGDFEYGRMLCQSVDRFVAPAISHRLFVPTRDLGLFAPLAGLRRTIGSQDRDLLPRWLWKLPMPKPRLREWLRLPRRNLYLSLYGPPVRGWIAQQIMKIAACADGPTEIVMHVDSDGVFIRRLTTDALVRPDGKVRFYRDPKPSDLATHQLWRATACRLLGLRPDSIEAGDYIGLCVVWRRSIVRRMIARIEEVGGGDWRKILARTPHFSEYTLYGLFVESLGISAAGHFITEASPVHCVWEEALADPEEEAAFTRALRPDQFACLIQSTVAMDLDARRRLFERVASRAREQDAGSARTVQAELSRSESRKRQF